MSIIMVDRISLLLKAKNITASQFADEIKVQRSSISHVLSGRNKPSLEFIQKILKRYPEINPDWLLFGKGPMIMEYNLFSDLLDNQPLHEETMNLAISKQEQMIRPVPEAEKVKSLSPQAGKEIDKEEETVKVDQSMTASDYRQSPVIQQPSEEKTNTPIPEKNIEKVLIFFNNRTFREYSPE